MKNNQKMNRRLQLMLLPLIAFMLVLYTVMPSVAFATDPKLTVDATTMTEANIETGNAKIVLDLTDAEWVDDFTDAKKLALINALVATNQSEQWEQVKNSIPLGNIVRTDIDTVTISIPSLSSYHLTANQTISLQLPYQLLKEDVNLPESSFDIIASPKALISGSATPTVSQSDILKGGKTIEVTLVNAKWISNIASNTAKREALLNAFNFGDSYKNIINANAKVIRTSDTVVTITLPAIPDFRVSGDSFAVKLDPNATWATPSIDTTQIEAFHVTPITDLSATISGSALSNINEFDIVKGEKTIMITLKNDVWVKDIASKAGLLMSGFSDKQLNAKSIVRKSDTEVEITLNGNSYDIDTDSIVSLTIDPSLLTFSTKQLEVQPTFKILAVKADVSGTAYPTLDPSDVIKGKKTIVVDLKNAEFDISKPITEYIKILQGSSAVTSALTVKDVKVTKNRVTFTLPAVPNFTSTGVNNLTVEIPQNLITGANKSIKADKVISIGQTATASLGGANVMIDTDIVNGGKAITITLGNGAQWDPTITSNKSKQAALLKGFTTSDQTKEWAKVIAAFKSSGKFELSGSTLTITLPAVAGYAIIRNQDVKITIPKSVIISSKSDVVVSGNLLITLPSLGNITMTFAEFLEGDLTDAIIKSSRLIVPKKNVESISLNTIDVASTGTKNSSITTIEVKTSSVVKKVAVTIGGVTKEVSGNNKFIFVFQNLDKNSEMKVSVFGNSNEQLQADIYKKIAKGSKTYNELPKKDLAGSYSLYPILTEKSLMKDILKYYSIDDLKVQR
ncbi:hypothetical protein MHB48_04045 [Psychrobacillus sp. FSL H8-0483]|uniref:hypothetical protein n=1 Tax=Psychrobacillus sp. FSL H8-0483 TaxID=2921389 RepID=UPI00315AC617